MHKISETSIAKQLLAKEARQVVIGLRRDSQLTYEGCRTEASFAKHPGSITKASKIKLVRYQQNPAPNWGPGTKADSGTKRKREEDE